MPQVPQISFTNNPNSHFASVRQVFKKPTPEERLAQAEKELKSTQKSLLTGGMMGTAAAIPTYLCLKGSQIKALPRAFGAFSIAAVTGFILGKLSS